MRAAFLLGLSLALLGASIRMARAGGPELLVTDVWADSEFVRLDFHLGDPLPPADSEGPTSAPPAALAFTIELWRARSGWFDRLVSSRTYGYRIEYDHWRSLYRAFAPSGEVIETDDRDVLVQRMCVQANVAGARIADLDPSKTYYFAVTARLTPIDINKLNEVDGWLSGEIRPATRRGGILSVPKAVVGILADLAGFGDWSIVARSSRFKALEEGGGIEPAERSESTE